MFSLGQKYACPKHSHNLRLWPFPWPRSWLPLTTLLGMIITTSESSESLLYTATQPAPFCRTSTLTKIGKKRWEQECQEFHHSYLKFNNFWSINSSQTIVFQGLISRDLKWLWGVFVQVYSCLLGGVGRAGEERIYQPPHCYIALSLLFNHFLLEEKFSKCDPQMGMPASAGNLLQM